MIKKNYLIDKEIPGEILIFEERNKHYFLKYFCLIFFIIYNCFRIKIFNNI